MRLGKRFRLDDAEKQWVEIVGIAKTSKYIFIAEPPSDFVYLPYRQKKPQRMIMVAQSAGDPSSLVDAAARGRARPRREPADLQRPHDGGVLSDARGQHLQRAGRHRGGDGADGTGSVDRRPVRSGRVRGQPAHPGNRHPHGDRRRPARPCCAWCCARASCWRSSAWSSACSPASARANCCAPRFPAATISATSSAVVLVAPDRPGGDLPRRLHSRPPRLADRSDEGAALRVTNASNVRDGRRKSGRVE